MILVFVAESFVDLLCGYYESGILIMDLWKSFKHNLKTKALIDIITIIVIILV